MAGAVRETKTLAVKTADGVIRVEVTDLSGPGVPQLHPSGDEAEEACRFGTPMSRATSAAAAPTTSVCSPG
jgi:hypothetical protein